MTRVLLCGVCLIGIQAGTAMAQVLATADTATVDRPMAIDGPLTPIPEIIRQPADEANVPQARAVADPDSALTPPTVNLQFLRAIRLDWDRVGLNSRIASDR